MAASGQVGGDVMSGRPNIQAKRSARTSRRSSSVSVDAKNRLVEVRAFIVALKRGNAREAKGRREMDA
jgi:hypothetical protein